MSWNVQVSPHASLNGGSALSHDINSDYMNFVDDGLFPDADFRMMATGGKTVSDDMALSYGAPKRNQMSGLMYAGNTKSLPPGLAPGSIARYNNMMSNPSPTSERYFVEHLASFPQATQDGHLTPAEALTKLKKISSGGGLWAQKMHMVVSSERLVMANAETKEVIEEYPVEQISLCITVLDDSIFDNLLIFSTKQSQDKVGAIHMLQCRGTEASVINEVVNKQRELKASHFMGGMNSRFSSSSLSASSSEADQSSPRQPETRTEWNLHQKHGVARAVEAFQMRPMAMHSNDNDTQPNSILTFAKITRDVEILNKCIEEVENFVVMLKRINEARKQLQQQKSKGSKKKKVENILILQCQPPPDHRIFDVYQKFKHSLNLLGKLQPHISEPSAPELIHYLFIPLGIIVKVTGIDKARSVVDPLLTVTAVDFLNNCLDSREYNFWQSLGPNWTLTKNSEPFKDRYFQPYTPIFADGWVPPEIISPKQEAVAKSTAAMVSRMHTSNGFDHVDQPPRNITPPDDHKVLITRISKISSPAEQHSSSTSSQQQKKMYKIGVVVYDYMAHNNKELTIRAGERCQILDDSRRWWLVRNNRNEQGYVPSTVLEIAVSGDQRPLSTSNLSETNNNINTGYSPNPINGQMQFTYSQEGQMKRSSSYEPPHTLSQQQHAKRRSSGFDTNQNYVNDDYNNPSAPQPVKSMTPVHISVQLPDGSDQMHRHQNGSVSHQTHSTTRTMNHNDPQVKPTRESPPYAMAASRKISNGFGGGEMATGQLLNGTQYSGYQRSTAFIKTQSSPPTVIHEEPMPPPPPPPPPAAPPLPSSVKSYTPTTAKIDRSQSTGEQVIRRDNSGELHSELKNRLSIVSGTGTIQKPESRERQELKHMEISPVAQNTTEVDAVDVFIPLYKSSTADDVSRWLTKLGFSQRTIDVLKGKTALQLFNAKKNDMVDMLGNAEGLQLYEELQVQNGAKPRHQTMTELQKAMVRRVHKREVQHEIVKANTPILENGGVLSTTNPPAVKAKPKGPSVKVKTVSPTTTPQATTVVPRNDATSLTITSVIQSVEPKQVTVKSTKNEAPMVTLSDQASIIKKQKEELERLKKENQNSGREPGKATFTSFSGNVNAATPQGKTQL